MEITNRQLSNFMGKIVNTGDCWLWTASRRGGYGRFQLNGRLVESHRLSYELFIGPIPASLHIDHLCRVRNCVCPTHLEPVTPEENNRRGFSPMAENARKTHCKHGHEFTEENTRTERLTNGRLMRQCRACDRLRCNPEGRKLGWRQRDKTHCKHGHEFTEANTLWLGNHRNCRACAKQKAFRQRREKGLPVKRRVDHENRCANGHEYTEGSYWLYGKKRVCKECKREWKREYRHKKREAA